MELEIDFQIASRETISIKFLLMCPVDGHAQFSIITQQQTTYTGRSKCFILVLQ